MMTIVHIKHSMIMRCVILVLLLAPALGMASSRSACRAGGLVEIQGATSAQQERLCAALDDGLAFLDANGMRLQRPIVLRVVGQLPMDVAQHAIGQYRARDGIIYLLDYARLAGNGEAVAASAFGIPMNADLWSSYAVHELAHAAAENRLRDTGSHYTASEYIAAVTQLETLSVPLQAQLRENYRGLEGFAAASEISMTYFLLDPARFAVKAWLHYRLPGNGGRFLQQLLDSGLPGANSH
jgi:hypothetical protein